MIKIQQKNRIRLETKQGFGKVVDIFFHIAFFQILFCFLITVYFNLYQNGKALFQPFTYLSLSIFLMFIIFCENRIVEHGKLVIIEIVTGVLFYLVIPIERQKMWIGFTILVLIVDSIWKHQYRFSEAASYAQRFRTSRKIFTYGVILVVLFFVHIFTSVDHYPGLESSNYFMLASFAVYLIVAVMVKYSFQFYDYNRQNVKIESNIKKNEKRTFVLFFVFLVVLIMSLVIIFAGVLSPFFTLIRDFGLKYIAMALLYILTKLKFDKNPDVDPYATAGSSVLDFINHDKYQNMDDPLSKMVPTFVILILLGIIIYGLWKLYKSILANSKIGKDETEFINVKVENKTYIESISPYKNIYGKSNSEKIRKFYYNTIEKRRKKFRIGVKKTFTPKEIEELLSAGEKEKMNRMTKYYEKARYSQEKCTEQDVEQVKQLNEQL